MSKPYVIAGPATIGNIFGSHGHTVPAGKFAVVRDCEYSNGGHGPCQCVQGLFDDEEKALRFAVVASPDLAQAEVEAAEAALPDDWREHTSASPEVLAVGVYSADPYFRRTACERLANDIAHDEPSVAEQIAATLWETLHSQGPAAALALATRGKEVILKV